MVSHLTGFGHFWLNERADDANASFDVGVEWMSVVWLMVVNRNAGDVH